MKTSVVIAISVLCCLSFASCTTTPQVGPTEYLMAHSEPAAQQSAFYHVPFSAVPFLNLIQRHHQVQKQMPEMPSAPRRPLLVRIITAYAPMAAPPQNSSTTPEPPSSVSKQDSEPVSMPTPAAVAEPPSAPTHVILLAPAPKHCGTCGFPSHQCSCQSRVVAAPESAPRRYRYHPCSSLAQNRDFGPLENAVEDIFEPSLKLCSSCGYPSQECNCYSRLAVAPPQATRSYCSCGLPPQHCVCRRMPEIPQVSALYPQCGCATKPCNCRSRLNLHLE